MACSFTPISAFQSTNLNSKIDSFCRLGDRIVRAMGAPLVSIEIHQDQLFENIAIACELFSKYAGYTKEYLIFNSKLYQRGKGIRLDHLYTLANSDLTTANKLEHLTTSRESARYVSTHETFYVASTAVDANYFTQVPSLSADYKDGLFVNQIIDKTMFATVTAAFLTTPTLSSLNIETYFTETYKPSITIGGDCAKENTSDFNNMFDYDIMDYRKVIAVTEFEEGSTTGINTLFTIEQTMAQQTYFSYAMGNYGFDLISWYTLKNWMETREKLLATKQSWEFNDRTQMLRIYPEPTGAVDYVALISCYVEKPLRDIIKEFWVYQYALALCKITVGQVRGKFGNLNVFGGQLYNTDIFREGVEEKKELEKQLFEGAAPGAGSADPVLFFVA